LKAVDFHWTVVAIDGRKKYWKYRPKVQISQLAGVNAAPSVSTVDEKSNGGTIERSRTKQ